MNSELPSILKFGQRSFLSKPIVELPGLLEQEKLSIESYLDSGTLSLVQKNKFKTALSLTKFYLRVFRNIQRRSYSIKKVSSKEKIETEIYMEI